MTRKLIEQTKSAHLSNNTQIAPTSHIPQPSSPSQISRNRMPTSLLQAIECIKSMASQRLAWQMNKSWISCYTTAMRMPSSRSSTRCQIIVREMTTTAGASECSLMCWHFHIYSLAEQPLCDDETRTSDHRTWERMSRLNSSWWVGDADHCDISEAFRTGVQDEPYQAGWPCFTRGQCKTFYATCSNFQFPNLTLFCIYS